MASNGRVGLRSGSPSFLVVGLSLVIVVLLYSYWSVSSRNSMLLRDQAYLQDRLRSLTSKHLAAEKKKSSAMAQIADMEKKKRQLEGNVMSSSKEKTELNSKIQALQQNLGQEKKKVATLHSQQSESKAELQKLKGDIDKTSEKLKELTAKANSFVDMYKNVKETLAKKIDELFKVQNDWHICQVKLSKLKEEHSAAEGTVNDKPKKIESLKGIGNNVFKNGIAQLKTQMNLGATKPSFQTVKTEPSAAVVTQVDKSVNSQTKAPTEKEHEE
ncbi:protein CASC4-like isoform X2 [Actinia tenebrosa]|uniref:Protein CASC4-like isoform X2 n=1 Tax=Actinia tenebrosa TaxID=6105 RepID=A0A6P8IKW4_ACTTE|nr:protein CASC4-like isoform X2 [Actinia tenebrosa]